MIKVQKHITECQNEVKSNIFHEAFSLIHDTAYHHPDDHATIEYHKDDVHDEYKHPNFTLTEQEILKFFETHHPSSEHTEHVGSGHLNSGVSYEHVQHEPQHEHELPHEQTFEHHPSQPEIVHNPHAQLYGWQQQQQQPYHDNVYKKTDAVQLNKPEQSQRMLRAMAGKRNPYTYFDIKTGDVLKKGEQQQRRSDLHVVDIHDDHHIDDHHHHHTDIHPTTATFKDKRIAGVRYPNSN